MIAAERCLWRVKGNRFGPKNFESVDEEPKRPSAADCLPVCWRSGQRSRPRGRREQMTWIRTIPFSEADETLREAIERQRALFPSEYAQPTPVNPDDSAGVVAAHSLIPDALYHAFATFGALLSPDLPLTRRQHEMITTVVSVTNRCFY